MVDESPVDSVQSQHPELERDGYVVIPLLGHSEIDALRRRFDALEVDPSCPFFASCNDLLPAAATAVDVELRGLASLVARTGLLGHVPFLGSFLSKGASPDSRVDMHQDLTYTDERSARAVILWAPLVDTSANNGALRVIPGSHLWSHGIRAASKGSLATAPIQGTLEARSIVLSLRAGEAVLYDPALVHGSDPNTTQDIRPALGLALGPENATLVHFHLSSTGVVTGARVKPGFASEYSLFDPPLGLPSYEPWAPVVTTRELVEAASSPLKRS